MRCEWVTAVGHQKTAAPALPTHQGAAADARQWLPRLAAATLLGATLGDRLRVNAKWALRGMFAQHAQQGTAGAAAGADARQLEFVGGLQSRLARWRLAAQVGLLRFAFWLGSLVHSATTYLVPMAE